MSERQSPPSPAVGQGALAYAPVVKSARISECGSYRYTLSRHWGPGEALVFVMLNPSTADADLDDPTIRRCIGFAKRDGFDGLVVVNLYAYRATDPKTLLTCADRVGPDNDAYLRMLLAERVRRGLPVVAGWGANADRDPERVGQVLELVPGVDWRCLGHSKSGAPKHPLYIKGDQPLIPLLNPDSHPSLSGTSAQSAAADAPIPPAPTDLAASAPDRAADVAGTTPEQRGTRSPA